VNAAFSFISIGTKALTARYHAQDFAYHIVKFHEKELRPFDPLD